MDPTTPNSSDWHTVTGISTVCKLPTATSDYGGHRDQIIHEAVHALCTQLNDTSFSSNTPYTAIEAAACPRDIPRDTSVDRAVPLRRSTFQNTRLLLTLLWRHESHLQSKRQPHRRHSQESETTQSEHPSLYLCVPTDIPPVEAEPYATVSECHGAPEQKPTSYSHQRTGSPSSMPSTPSPSMRPDHRTLRRTKKTPVKARPHWR